MQTLATAPVPSFEEVQDYAYSLHIFIVPDSYAARRDECGPAATVRTTKGHLLECWYENGQVYGEY
jgi:hypothetical protein